MTDAAASIPEARAQDEPASEKPERRYRGRLDRIEPRRAAGWAYVEGAEEPAKIAFFQNDVELGVATADRHRADLEHIGDTKGRCAFLFTPPDGVDLDPARLSVFFLGTRLSLQRSRGNPDDDDPVIRRVISLEDAVTELRDVIAARFRLLERGMSALGQARSQRDAQQDEKDGELAGLVQAVRQLEAFLSVRFAGNLQQVVERTAAETVRQEMAALRRSLLWIGGGLLLCLAGLGGLLYWLFA